MKILVIDFDERAGTQIESKLLLAKDWPEDQRKPDVVSVRLLLEAKHALARDPDIRVVVCEPMLRDDPDGSGVDAYEFVREHFPGVSFFFASPTFTDESPPSLLVGWGRLPKGEPRPTWRLLDMFSDEWESLSWLRAALFPDAA